MFMARVGGKIANRSPALGWTAWYDSYVEQKEQMEMMQRAGARLAMRGQSMMFTTWRETCGAEPVKNQNLLGD